MDCPFPGMDPFLENPKRWRGVHNRLIISIHDFLNEQMPENFVARLEERYYIVPDRDVLTPDILLSRDRLTTLPSRTDYRSGVATAVVERAAPSGIVTVQPEEVGEPFLEILSDEETDHVVTIIEVLSPTNKGLTKEGRASYVEKQAAIRQSQTHLLEIDLLRSGEHTVAVPRYRLDSFDRWDYIISLHRAGTYNYEVWLSRVREALPEIKVPLSAGYPDVILPMAEIFAETYRTGRYYKTDYTKEPVPPLSEDDTSWADALLKEKGFRP